MSRITVNTTTEVIIDLSKDDDVNYMVTIINTNNKTFRMQASQIEVFMRYAEERFDSPGMALDALYNAGKSYGERIDDEIPF